MQPHIGLFLILLFAPHSHTIVNFALLLNSVYDSEVFCMPFVNCDRDLLFADTILKDLGESLRGAFLWNFYKV
jgi:hypothetical protein